MTSNIQTNEIIESNNSITVIETNFVENVISPVSQSTEVSTPGNSETDDVKSSRKTCEFISKNGKQCSKYCFSESLCKMHLQQTQFLDSPETSQCVTIFKTGKRCTRPSSETGRCKMCEFQASNSHSKDTQKVDSVKIDTIISHPKRLRNIKQGTLSQAITNLLEVIPETWEDEQDALSGLVCSFITKNGSICGIKCQDSDTICKMHRFQSENKTKVVLPKKNKQTMIHRVKSTLDLPKTWEDHVKTARKFDQERVIRIVKDLLEQYDTSVTPEDKLNEIQQNLELYKSSCHSSLELDLILNLSKLLLQG